MAFRRRTRRDQEEGDRSPSPLPQLLRALDWTSLDTLTESILRRIMRMACLVGCLGMLAAVFSPRPLHGGTFGLAVALTVAVFAATYLPMRVRLLSLLYPGALVLIGVAVAGFLGPRADGFILLAGGVFIGALVLRTPALLTMTAAASLGLLWAVTWERAPTDAESQEAWSSAISAMLAVIAPLSVAGRMLVAALARALDERDALLEEVVTERTALQSTIRDLETTRSQLTHAQKLELMSQMAGGIAHDMNNALTAVIGEASLLDDSVSEERERILSAGEYAAKLTHQLMVFARRDTSKPKLIDLIATLTNIVQSVRRVIPSDVVIATEFPSENLAVFADPVHLLQVLFNLATNAKDAMPNGGTLGIGVQTNTTRSHVTVSVRDTGTGISPENSSRIFEPFFTTKPAGYGTGLGLANVKHLVTQMFGTVSVTSTLGEGTTFEVTLPLVDAAPLGSDIVASEQVTRKVATILVVDDDVRVRAVVFTALQRVGHRVLEASSVASALELVREHGSEIDLLLTDVVMGGGGGAETIRAVREVLPQIRILVMSGYANDETVRRGVAQDEYPFVAKPFTSETLNAAVDRALAS